MFCLLWSTGGILMKFQTELPFVFARRRSWWPWNNIRDQHNDPPPSAIHYRAGRMSILQRQPITSILTLLLQHSALFSLPVAMSQWTRIGSSPTPWPSGSIQYMSDLSVGSAARSSWHVLTMKLFSATLLSFFNSFWNSSSNLANLSANIFFS